MADLHQNPNVKRPFDGAHGPSLIVPEIKYQEIGGHCALNAVANGINIPPELYHELRSNKPSLEQVVDRLSEHRYQFSKPKGVIEQCLLPWLLQQTTGVFAVKYDAHCCTWDAANQRILDTDPRFPVPLPITAATLTLLQIQRIHKVYQILPMPSKKRAK